MDRTLEHDVQFLARILIATREDDQISRSDAQQLNELAQFGRRNSSDPQRTTTLPEERRTGDRPLTPATEHDRVMD